MRQNFLDPKKKDLGIDTIRGLALFLMVAGHVIGDSMNTGMRVADDSTLRYLYESLIYVRMPLFTAISGFVYAMRPVGTTSSLSVFFQGKFRRIAVPMLVVSTLFFISQALVPNTNNPPRWADMYHIYLFGYAHFWFLQSILCIFALIAVLEKAGLLRSLGQFLVVSAVALVASYNYDEFPELFSLDRAAHLLPFFLLGLGVFRFREVFVTTVGQWLVGGVLLAMVTLDQGYLLGRLSFSDPELQVMGLIMGLTAIYTLITQRRYFAPLAWLGGHSFEIYLFHVFGTAGGRMLLNKLNIHSTGLTFLVSMTFGLVLPVLLKKAVGRMSLLNLALFGTEVQKSRPLKVAVT
ncbi:acyltransferase [Pseudomonas sp. HR96]|uniref:acyltransferase family protein n=1 Tax=Pseudomonas sp. HR96 TaxID=1027966 RepID=UPI002A74A23F|nr:acyltransferase [Pseudomonas sp. HR96]WPO98322.1 acyltransferase [Pseudomonas sp. HR96]